MNIFEKIKDFLNKYIRKEDTKLLTEGMPKENIQRKKFIEDLSVNNNGIKEPSIEDCICEFIKQYKLQEEFSNEEVDSYKAFIRMFCAEEEPENNPKNQEKLSQYVKKMGYRTDYQYSGDKISFMHISGKIGVNEEKNKDVEKLYINCDRKNIALLTTEIFKKINGIVGDKLQMKCISEQLLKEQKEYEKNQKIKNYQRNDKIVIYAENSTVADRIAEEINIIRNEKPQLFSKNKTVPFLPKKCGFIGFAKEKRGDYVQTPIGIASGKTYNDYLADIFYQSVVSGFDNEFGINSVTSKESPKERMKQYVSVFQDFSSEQRESVLKKCKDVFINTCVKGNVKTIYSKNLDNYKDLEDKSR